MSRYHSFGLRFPVHIAAMLSLTSTAHMFLHESLTTLTWVHIAYSYTINIWWCGTSYLRS